MPELVTIELNNLRFHAYHGLFPGERQTGNEFEVNLRVDTIPPAGTITSLQETVNYATLYEIVQQEMGSPRDLLETLATEIAEKIHQSFSFIKNISITITKLHPPIPRFRGEVSITYQKEF